MPMKLERLLAEATLHVVIHICPQTGRPCEVTACDGRLCKVAALNRHEDWREEG